MEFTDFFDFFASYCINAFDLVLNTNRNESGVKKLINIIKNTKYGDKMSINILITSLNLTLCSSSSKGTQT